MHSKCCPYNISKTYAPNLDNMYQKAFTDTLFDSFTSLNVYDRDTLLKNIQYFYLIIRNQGDLNQCVT